ANGGTGIAAATAGGRLLPALAPVHVRQTANDGAEDADGSSGSGAAAAVCMLQLDGGGTLSLVPSDVPPPSSSLPSARVLDFATTSAAAADVKYSQGPCSTLRFSLVRRNPAPPAAATQPYRELQVGAQGMQAAVMRYGGGSSCGDGSVVPLLAELATYLVETQRQDCLGGSVAEGSAEAELLDLPTAGQVLRQLTDELQMRRRRFALQPPQSQPQALTHTANPNKQLIQTLPHRLVEGASVLG
ncbi:hypothetical protein VaNZ11_011350, partial [Volvox africanus]